MKNGWRAIWILAAACVALAGCDGGSEDEAAGYHPAVDVNGNWNVQADGVDLGVMALKVSSAGRLTGTLATPQGAVAQLDGAMDGYGAEFTVTFPTEHYFAAITFTENAEAATGALLEERGFRQTLVLRRPVAVVP